MRIEISGVDVTSSWRREVDGLDLGEESLSEPVQSLLVALPDVPDRPLAIRPAIGHTIEVLDDVGVKFFTGRIASLSVEVRPVGKHFTLGCQSWGIRLMETATGSLNRLGVISSDRIQVIEILKDALMAQPFGPATIDDPIYIANELAGWPLVQGTALISGHDYSYMETNAALRLLMRDVPGVSLRIQPDLLVAYGTSVNEATKALTTTYTTGAYMLASRYKEEEIVGDHRNKLRIGGAGTAEVTARDEVSMAQFGRILDAPYVNDENIPAADLERVAYAKLRALRVRRRIRAETLNPDAKVGDAVHVYSERAGQFEPEGGFPDLGFSFFARNPYDGLDAEYRGEMIVQRIGRRRVGAGPDQQVTLDMGDAVIDFVTTLARGVGGNV